MRSPNTVRESMGYHALPVRMNVQARFACRLLFLFVLAVLLGCSGTDKQGRPESNLKGTPYEGWQYFSQGKVSIMFPPGHPNESDFPNMCRNYQGAMNKIITELAMPPYTDTLLIIYYTGYGQGREKTGREYPFGNDTAVHLWLPSFPGPPLMQHLLTRWSGKSPRYRFVREGLIAMYDFSGQRYHESTIGYYNKGDFIPLAKLATDTAVNSNKERYQTAEAASFCAFVLGNWGAVRLKQLYEANLPFELEVKKDFGMPVDSLQSLWLLYIRQNVPRDSIIDSLWE